MKKLIVLISLFFLLYSCASLKPHPRPWTKAEKGAAIFFLVAHTADYYTTEKFLDKPGYYEMNPILGEHPTDAKLTLYFSITGFIALTLGHWYPELRLPLFLSYGTVNTYYAIHNSKLD